MNANQFLELIHNADSLSNNELVQLNKVRENFPYFQIAHTLVARQEFLKNNEQPSYSLGFAAVTSPDRIWLKQLIEAPKPSEEAENVAAENPEHTIKVEEKTETPKAAKLKEEKSASLPNEETTPKPKVRKKRTPHKDDLIEAIKRREKKAVLDSKKKEQNDLIKAFSKTSIKKATIKEIEANKNPENLAAASTQIKDNLHSESYAKILAKQGKKQMAIEIYDKLILKFPDKRTYFADLIEKLKD